MQTPSANSDQIAEALETLRQEVARLGARAAALERGAGLGNLQPATAFPAPASAPEEGINEEILLAISAAVAAYLGKKPHVRQIRLVGAGSWALQGRATIQASHALGARHGRDPQ
jgi:methylmalonyl-CoA carboxyltransferase 12S subunit